jgi:hypothetical protein
VNTHKEKLERLYEEKQALRVDSHHDTYSDTSTKFVYGTFDDSELNLLRTQLSTVVDNEAKVQVELKAIEGLL